MNTSLWFDYYIKNGSVIGWSINNNNKKNREETDVVLVTSPKIICFEN